MMLEQKATTIRVHQEVKRALDKLKIHPRETYEDVLRRVLELEEWRGMFMGYVGGDEQLEYFS